MTKVKDAMEKRLREIFAPSVLEIIDDSDSHKGHMGNPGGGETHFTVRIKSRQFEGQNLLQQHRTVNEALAEFLSGPVHALRLETTAK